jgi:hypothetical protein
VTQPIEPLRSGWPPPVPAVERTNRNRPPARRTPDHEREARRESQREQEHDHERPAADRPPGDGPDGPAAGGRIDVRA